MNKNSIYLLVFRSLNLIMIITSLSKTLLLSQPANQIVITNVSVGFISNENKKITLFMKNTAQYDNSVICNIEGVTTSTFLGFPRRGLIQYRYGSGKIAVPNGAGADGWLYPSLFSSQVCPTEKMDLMKKIVIPRAKGVSYPLELEGAFRVARSSLPLSEGELSEFRIKLLINVLDAGTVVRKEIISPWYPYPIPDMKR